jgi:hypothetical protein
VGRIAHRGENQVGSIGEYKRQTTIARLLLAPVSDPAHQEISLG